ncbi:MULTISPECIES: CS1 type fimbrial major subunit [unclassified Pseudomonas]|uniref:CS1 type fimbrial major subunit n=1 Tax=unclassified Pseudomonas TaxID=196821 RepID=UPI001F592516
MNRSMPQWRLSAVLLLCGLVLLSFSAIAAREEAVFHVSVKVPTSDFFVLALNPGFLEREQVMHYNLVTGHLSPLREPFDVKNVLGGINARLGFAPVLSNGTDVIALQVTFNGHRLDVVDTLVVPENEARVGKRVPLVIAAEPPPVDGYLPGQYYGSVQIIFDALRP